MTGFGFVLHVKAKPLKLKEDLRSKTTVSEAEEREMFSPWKRSEIDILRV